MNDAVQSVPRFSRRPERVDALLYLGESYEEWFFANRSANRFFVLNLSKIMTMINIEHTLLDRNDFDEAEHTISNSTNWPAQYPFDYTSSRTQVYPDKIYNAKRFGQAATIIVAMEVMARKRRSDLNVYNYMRVIPAHYFVDQLDLTRLAALSQFHDAMSPSSRTKNFGAANAEKSFEQTCLALIEQNYNREMITQLASGACVTRFIAEHIIEFVQQHYPGELHVGPVRAAGEQAISSGLGRKNAVDNMRVPRYREPSDLPPIA